MSVSIKIETCEDCPYVSHSGVFTPGGAKPTCDGVGAVEAVTCYKLSEGKELKDPYHWKHRVIRNKRKDGSLMIPTWCPLKEIMYGEQIVRRMMAIMEESIKEMNKR